MTASERVNHLKKFIKKAPIDTIQVLLPIPLPGTELRTRLANQNRIFPLDDIGWKYYDGNFPLIISDSPLTPEEAQFSIRKIMGRFYHMRSVLRIIYNIFSIPRLLLYPHAIKYGWKIWYRNWRNSLIQFFGWRTIKNWTCQFRKGTFCEQLEKAKQHVNNADPDLLSKSG